jgi:hypothetical protein
MFRGTVTARVIIVRVDSVFAEEQMLLALKVKFAYLECA